MKVRMSRIGPLSLGKMTGIIASIFGLSLGLLAAVFGDAIGGPILGSHWLADLIGLTAIYAIGGFVFGVLYAVLYNLLASLVGGIEIEFDDT